MTNIKYLSLFLHDVKLARNIFTPIIHVSVFKVYVLVSACLSASWAVCVFQKASWFSAMIYKNIIVKLYKTF